VNLAVSVYPILIDARKMATVHNFAGNNTYSKCFDVVLARTFDQEYNDLLTKR